MAPVATGEMAPMHLPVYKSKSSSVTASVLHGPRDLRLETRSIQEPSVGELQISVKRTGICGSDVSYYKKFANGDLCACHPLSLGHESSGEVVAIGPQVTGFKLGDRVALEVGVPCGQCTICRKGRYNLCKKMRFRSSAKSVPHYQGTLQERINHPAAWCHKIPDHVSYEAAALLEPLSVAIHAVNRAKPEPGSTALVIGAGTVGLLTAAMARQAGCAQVTITDVDAGRVEYAVEKGFATHGHVVNSNSGTSTPADPGVMTPASIFSVQSVQGKFEGAKSLAAEILALTKVPEEVDMDCEDDGVDVTFECTGKEVCMQTSLYATRPGGKVVMVGMGTPVQTLPLSVAHLREIDILGIFRYANTYPTGVRLLCAKGNGGLPCLDDMVTHRFKGLHNASKAFELASRTCDDEGKLVLKVVIEA
ncbi:alcohol dehydrogenase GroES-like domain-containing protein [Colletotrichum higginsianum]|uniref:Alcohol dehydrogenase GroES-like domain-containing protein n=2 Tax=Colletotrichum higginsianum TaxID=80884 RepID=H1VPY2_COLHI|nr:Alcohol dehydrogenase GroES-like domain-containing protein [Colletotrichum higginsianum IMI 349063]OBR09110.1 Alcohol dehydrogenase GroES-like domain-containing protein [Colletotrichum higginsianum IMI 349063]TIC95360.1 Sorbitol dehydrogenase [Colletotrichum higginsianum]CCF42288.1 alcohol dehydrogenase GroES-like domain-containing protein [Colletotrichum higginsianum]